MSSVKPNRPDYAQRANAPLIHYYDSEIKFFLGEKAGQKYIDGGFLDQIASLYSSGDLEFLADICNRFERVKLGFAYFSLLSDDLKGHELDRLAWYQLRTGWQRKMDLSLAFNQSVADHHMCSAEMSRWFYLDDPEFEKIRNISLYHDLLEVVVSDFTPFCDITKQERSRLEKLAFELVISAKSPLAEEFLYNIALYEGYYGFEKDQALKTKFKDIDRLEMAVESVFLFQSFPDNHNNTESLEEFWDRMKNQIVMPRCKAFYEALYPVRHTRKEEASLQSLVQKALTHAIQETYSGGEIIEPKICLNKEYRTRTPRLW